MMRSDIKDIFGEIKKPSNGDKFEKKYVGKHYDLAMNMKYNELENL